MAVLNDAEKALVLADVREMIESAGETARVLRPTMQDSGFTGKRETGFTEVYASIPCEVHHLRPEDIRMKGHDLEVHVLPDADVREGDVLELEGHRYRVTDVVERDCFGVITHKELSLERDRRG